MTVVAKLGGIGYPLSYSQGVGVLSNSPLSRGAEGCLNSPLSKGVGGCPAEG